MDLTPDQRMTSEDQRMTSDPQHELIQTDAEQQSLVRILLGMVSSCGTQTLRIYVFLELGLSDFLCEDAYGSGCGFLVRCSFLVRHIPIICHLNLCKLTTNES